MQWINIETICANVIVENWEDAVQKSGELLVAANLVEPAYINAMLETTRELGPYCVLAPGIAMPHARPDNNVRETGFSAITLKNPVEFGNQDNDPVYLVIGFCAKDHESHIKSLSQFARIISQPGFIERIKLAESDFELEKILNGSNTE